jgi:hypothetical protein
MLLRFIWVYLRLVGVPHVSERGEMRSSQVDRVDPSLILRQIFGILSIR